MVKILTGSRALKMHGFDVPTNDWDYWNDKKIPDSDTHIVNYYEENIWTAALVHGNRITTPHGSAILPPLSILKVIYLYHYGIRNSRAYSRKKAILDPIKLGVHDLWLLKEARKGLLIEAHCRLFEDNVQRSTDHDQLHRMVVNGTPAREQVKDFSRRHFRYATHKQKVRYIAEEICVLALEREHCMNESDWLVNTKKWAARFSVPYMVAINPVYLSNFAATNMREILADCRYLVKSSPIKKFPIFE